MYNINCNIYGGTFQVHRQKFDLVLKRVSNLFRILSHPDRIRLIGLLLKKEMDVGSLAEASRISHSSVSQHLKLLKLNQLVEERRSGHHIFYRLKGSGMQQLIMVAVELQTAEQTAANETIVFQEMLSLWRNDADQ